MPRHHHRRRHRHTPPPGAPGHEPGRSLEPLGDVRDGVPPNPISSAELRAAVRALTETFGELMGGPDAIEALPPDIQAMLDASTRETWSGWKLPPDSVRELFRAAAHYWNSAPWDALANDQLLAAGFPDGHRRIACVLGGGGAEFGLALYADLADLVAHLSDEPSAALRRLRGPVLSVTFEPAEFLSPRMTREIRKAKWEVAGPFAYPLLMALNAPAVSMDDARDLTTLLGAIPRFVERFRAVVTGERDADLPIEWTDADTGVSLTYSGFLDDEQGGPPYIFTAEPPLDIDDVTPSGALARAGAGELPPRYTFILNPYVDARLSRCPACDGRTHPRKFPLRVVVRDYGTVVLGKTCRYCTECELIIAHEDEMRAELDATVGSIAPEAIGSPFLVVGTVERETWKASLGGNEIASETLFAHTADIDRVLDLVPYYS